jgi:Domain of unknown function (DUF4388)
MALHGSLDDFSLPEILQLIAVQQKTGMLSVNAGDKSSVLFFRDGKIVSTRDRRSKTRDPFREYLTRYGCLKREELVRITQLSAQSKLDLVDVLVSENIFDEKALARHWRNHLQETLHEILTWDQLSYKFISGDDVVAGVKALGEHIVEPLLMECMRRIDEYPMLQQLFPGDTIKIASTGRKPEPDAQMMTSEKTVLAIVDTPRTLRDIIARAQMPSFDVYEALKFLKEKGLIAVEEGTGLIGTEAGTAARVRRGKRTNPMLALAAAFTFASCLLFGVVRNTDHVVRVAQDGLVARDTAARGRVEHRLRFLVEAYRAENGTYPMTLDALRQGGYADRATLGRASELQFQYRLTRDGAAYTLL